MSGNKPMQINAIIHTKRKSLVAELTLPNSGGGTSDYEYLTNKPSIEYVTLVGNKNFPDLGLDAISTEDLLEILS